MSQERVTISLIDTRWLVVYFSLLGCGVPIVDALVQVWNNNPLFKKIIDAVDGFVTTLNRPLISLMTDGWQDKWLTWLSHQHILEVELDRDSVLFNSAITHNMCIFIRVGPKKRKAEWKLILTRGIGASKQLLGIQCILSSGSWFRSSKPEEQRQYYSNFGYWLERLERAIRMAYHSLN
jgi:hypothetical protein